MTIHPYGGTIWAFWYSRHNSQAKLGQDAINLRFLPLDFIKFCNKDHPDIIWILHRLIPIMWATFGQIKFKSLSYVQTTNRRGNNHQTQSILWIRDNYLLSKFPPNSINLAYIYNCRYNLASPRKKKIDSSASILIKFHYDELGKTLAYYTATFCEHVQDSPGCNVYICTHACGTAGNLTNKWKWYASQFPEYVCTLRVYITSVHYEYLRAPAHMYSGGTRERARTGTCTRDSSTHACAHEWSSSTARAARSLATPPMRNARAHMRIACVSMQHVCWNKAHH